METKDLVFDERHKKSIEDTKQVLAKLYKSGHFEDCRLASKTEDIAGVDSWIDGSPCQMKVREPDERGNVRTDYLVAIHQPFLGLEHSRTNFRWETKFDWGRDYQGLVNHKSDYYYVAPMRGPDNFLSISRCESNELREIATNTVEAWLSCETVHYQKQYSLSIFTPEMTETWMNTWPKRLVFTYDQSQIWWHKNKKENYGKFLLFVPQHIVESNQVLWSKA